jgi:hypothetical protein
MRRAVCCLGLICSGCVVVPAPVPPAPPPRVAAHPPPPAPPEPECREFQQMVIIGGREEEAYGTSCRQADGSWHLAAPRDYPRAPPRSAAPGPGPGPGPAPAYVGYRGPYLIVPVEPPSDDTAYRK